jgi:hypothetical protein
MVILYPIIFILKTVFSMKKISLFLSAALMLAVVVMSACKGNTPESHDKFFGTWKSTVITGTVLTDDETLNATLLNILPDALAAASAEFIFKDDNLFSSTFKLGMGEGTDIVADGSYSFTETDLLLTAEGATEPQTVPYQLDGATLTVDYTIDPAIIQNVLGALLKDVTINSASFVITLNKQ